MESLMGNVEKECSLKLLGSRIGCQFSVIDPELKVSRLLHRAEGDSCF